MTAPPLPNSLKGRLDAGPDTPEVLRVGDEAWINVDDLCKLLNYRARRAQDHGYKNALLYLRASLADLARAETTNDNN